MSTSNRELATFIQDHANAAPTDACFQMAYLRREIDLSPAPEFLRFGGEGHGHPVLLAMQMKAGKRERIEHGTGRRFVEKYFPGMVRAWRRLPFADSVRGPRAELLHIFEGSKKIEMVAATAIWSTPMA